MLDAWVFGRLRMGIWYKMIGFDIKMIYCELGRLEVFLLRTFFWGGLEYV
jgi:hypothetical protein